MKRLRLTIAGAVQGVGFRPFVFRLATTAGLTGWVTNTAHGVLLEVEGREGLLESFREAIERDKPSLSIITGIRDEWLEPAYHDGFEIRKSLPGRPEAIVLPDIATCPKCLAEISDPSDRRYGYPFTNCTNCGPRYSIIRALPYDRISTTMATFEMCPDCLREYEDPADRRFHAQPNACPVCGPSLALWDTSGNILAEGREALLKVADAVRMGQIAAVKGLGGFHLIAPASSALAIEELRSRKRRRRKPFALMFPSMDSIRSHCQLSSSEEALLESPQSPIVLLRKKDPTEVTVRLPEIIAPGNPYLGVMLPYTPLHHLLMQELNAPVIATSGNISDEPICIDESEALERLSGLADIFLVHDRPIHRHVDDSIVKMSGERMVILRRARGYAPLPMEADRELPVMLAFGAHLKNTLALSIGRNVFISQHIGDLETPQAARAFDEVRESIEDLYHARPVSVIHDLHPDYISTARASSDPLPSRGIQHHLAHLASCMLENAAVPPLAGVSWDGAGYGPDGTVWGGEIFHITDERCLRAGHLRTFRLPGGSRAVKEPRRSAAGLLFEMNLDPFKYLPKDSFREEEITGLLALLRTGTNSPVTSSMGRLFDAAASLCGLFPRIEFEGEAAMAFEYAIPAIPVTDAYTAPVRGDISSGMVLDWEPMFHELLRDLSNGVEVPMISTKFHNALVTWIVTSAELVGEERVALSGGCFQNTYLMMKSETALKEKGFLPLVHGKIPPNDGGIAPGQLFAAACLPSLIERS